MDDATEMIPTPGDRAAGKGSAADGPAAPGEAPRRRWWLWIAIAVGALLVAGAIVAAVVLAGPSGPIVTDASSSPTASSASPSPSPSASPSIPPEPSEPPPPPPPPPTGPVITSFSVTPATVNCSDGGPEFPGVTSAQLTITWTSMRGAEAYIGVDTDDAQAARYAGPLPADSGRFTELNYNCPDTHRYTVTIVGTDGTKVSETREVVNIGQKRQ